MNEHTEMPFHQVELLDALSSPIAAGIINVLHSSSSFVSGLERAFRFEGSKIRWDLVNGHISMTEGERHVLLFPEFFGERCRELGTSRTAIYLNDGPVAFALSATLFAFQRHLSEIISIPAHHYFIAEDFAWCIAYTMEGDIDFGWSALKSL
ncbi:hypothetical protein OVA07_18665 [Novosphingobium sp. SL115]|uniref:hypothetical protein n=1 Tax=Novosphingobium sp. SL115 TaxID=2995150 RepID=UPI00227493C6|nr:hypothetical protein [Novosphingobium sp. SL115]MCY1673031.1 hypothetical protein [Novosphingobium sp. SL115]